MDYLSQVNYLIPVYRRELKKEEILFIKDDLNAILDQQIMISQLSSGITYQDTENMDEYERSYIFSKLVRMKQDEIEAKQKAYEEMKQKTRG